MNPRFEGKVALVTGGSRGIGAAVARLLAAEGARVVINYRANVAAAEETVSEIRTAGGEAELAQGDVSRPDEIEKVMAVSLAHGGRLDILVNNAGITRDQLIMRMSEADWDSVLDTNLKGVFLLTKAAIRPMLRQHSGRIVNIASISGIIGNAGQANYSASKAGLLGLTRSVAREVASRQITCNAIAAGVIDTEIWQGVPEAAVASMLNLIPLGRKGLVGDIAQAVAFLASDAASYITGQVLNVDGGMVMG